jgi:hypothetical protein
MQVNIEGVTLPHYLGTIRFDELVDYAEGQRQKVGRGRLRIAHHSRGLSEFGKEPRKLLETLLRLHLAKGTHLHQKGLDSGLEVRFTQHCSYVQPNVQVLGAWGLPEAEECSEPCRPHVPCKRC